MTDLLQSPTSFVDLINYQPGAVVSRELVNQSGGTVTLFAFDQNEGLSEHSAPFDVLIFILEGQAEVTLLGQQYQLQANWQEQAYHLL